MSATVPILEPTEIQAGNTLKWNRTFGDYPTSEGWALTYSVKGIVGQIDNISAAVVSGEFQVRVSADTTAGWIPGDYWLVGYVSLLTERYEVFRGAFTITPNLGDSQIQFDGRGYWARILAKIKQSLELGIVREVIEIDWGGVHKKYRTTEELMKILERVEAKAKLEELGNKPRPIFTRFVSAR